MHLAALVLAAATSIGGIEDFVLAHPGDLEIPRLHHVLAPFDESGTSWQGVVLGGASGYDEEDPAGFAAMGVEVAMGGAGSVRPSVFGGFVESDLTSWMAGAAIHGRHAFSPRSSLHFRGSYAYQTRLGDDPLDRGDDVFRFTVPIPDSTAVSSVDLALDDVTWGRYRLDVSFAHTLRQSGQSRAALVLESGVHLTHHSFEGVNDAPLNLDILYPTGTYRTTESENTWSGPIAAFLAWRGGRLSATIGVRSDVEFLSMLGLIGAGVTI